MPKPYQVFLYKNTGFNTSNVPGGTEALPVGRDEFPAVFEWQNKYIAIVRIDATWDQVKDVDYLQLGEPDPQYFVVDNVQMLSAHTAQMNLIFDPILSAGGVDALTVIGGWARRAHASTDELFANTYDEPWTPSAPLRITNKRYKRQQATRDAHNIVICTCDLDKADEVAAAIAWVANDETGEDGHYIIYPLTPTMTRSTGTNLQILDLDADGTETVTGSYKLPFMFAFDLGTDAAPNTDLVDKLEKLRSIAIESAIVNAYVLPSNAIGGMTVDDTHLIDTIAGSVEKLTSDLPYEYGTYVPKNKKVYALYSVYNLTAISSGGSSNFDAFDLFEPGTTEPSLILFTDVAPNGTAYLRPNFYKGEQTHLTEQTVAGLPWLTAGILYTTGSGSQISVLNGNRRLGLQQYERERMYEGFAVDNVARAWQGITGIGSGLLGSGANAGNLSDFTIDPFALLGNIGNAVSTDLNARRNQDIQAARTNKAIGDTIFDNYLQQVKAPEIAFPISVNIASYRGNEFMMYHVGLSEADMQRLDKWFTAYGYACDKTLEKSDLTNRQAFNYVKTMDAQISAPGLSEMDCEMISEVLNRGIRIWHKPPTAAAYDDNPVKGGGS